MEFADDGVFGLDEEEELDGGDDATVKHIRKRAKWDNDDYVCRGLILKDLRFGKIVSLFNVLHVPNIRKNLVSSSVLNNYGYKQVIESNKSVLSKDGFVLHSKDEALDKFKVVKTEVKLQQGSQIKRFKTDRGGEYMDTLGIECIFVGYAEHSKAFRFYVIEPNDSVLINSIIESRDAIFDENRLSSVPRPSRRLPNVTEYIGGLVVLKEVTEEVVQQPEPELRKSKRNRTSKDFGPEFQLYLIEGTRDEVSGQHSYCFNVEDDPKKFDEAMKFQDVAFWKEAINDEIDSIMGNNNCGIKQNSRVDYFDAYALVARISTIRLLIAIASIHNLNIHQMDVKTVFLNGELDEIYMNQSQGFILLGNKNKAFKKQTCITGSTIEYEFVALVAAGKETEWLKNLLFEIPLWYKPIAPIFIRCDSAATLAKVYSQMYNGKFRNLSVMHSMIRELITNGVISIEFVRFLADHLTKGLARDLVIKSAEGMGLKSN
nr:zinc finger, CCHC-type [Tanacetum cinerariifolium]